MIEVHDLVVEFGPVRALGGVSLSVGQGQIGTVIGSNGAGKSTLLKAISGLVKPTSGSIALTGHGDIGAVAGHRRPGLGVAHVLEGHRVFGDQSVEANLRLGALTRGRGHKAEVQDDIDQQCLRFPILGKRRKQLAATLSGGEQQMLATATALMAKPRVLLLDEPSLGLAPALVEQTFELIAQLRAEGQTILLVEQRASMALEISDVAWILVRGEVTRSGPAHEMLVEADLTEAYLGGSQPDDGSAFMHTSTHPRQHMPSVSTLRKEKP